MATVGHGAEPRNRRRGKLFRRQTRPLFGLTTSIAPATCSRCPIFCLSCSQRKFRRACRRAPPRICAGSSPTRSSAPGSPTRAPGPSSPHAGSRPRSRVDRAGRRARRRRGGGAPAPRRRAGQEDVKEGRKGPRVGAPEGAIQGLLRSAGLNAIHEAKVAADKKGDFYLALIEKPGRPAIDVIAEVVPEVVKTFPWPKSMRWGEPSRQSGSLAWVRPLHS